jgi:hypothetical protein
VLADIWALASIHLRQLAPGATVGFFVIDQARHAAVLAHACGQSAARLNGLAIALGERVTGWAAATGRVMTNADARLDLDGGGDPADPRFALALPLLGDRGVIAVVTLYAPDRFAVDVTRRLEMIAPHLATAVAGAQGVPSAASPTESQRTRSSRSDLHLVARR